MKKTVPIFTVFLVILLLLVVYDNIQLRRINTPPVLEVTVGGKKVEAYPKEFLKNEKVTVFSFKKRKEQTYTVNPRTKIKVSFENQPETFRIVEGSPYSGEEEVINREVNNRTGERTFLIQAKWEDKREAAYEIYLNVKETVSYQELLAQSEGEYSLFTIGPNREEELSRIDFPINQSMNIDSLEQAKINYPDLKLDSQTVYILFNYREEVFRSDNLKDFTAFLKSYNP
jgi:hypothetical protein